MSKASNTVEAFMPWWIADYMRDTMHLTRDQHGGYLLLLAAYWTGGGALPDNDARLAAIVKATPAEWRKLRPVYAEFFTIADGKWVSKRAEEELERARELRRKRVERATKASHARRQDDRGDDLGDISKTISGTSISSHISQKESSAASAGVKPDHPVDRVVAALGGDLNDPKWHHAPAHVRRWIDLGYDLERHILPVIAERSAGKSIGNLKYFDAAIAERHGQKPMARAAVTITPPANRAVALRRAQAAQDGTWTADWGPRRGEPGCLIPDDVWAEIDKRRAA